jgi:pyridoxal phosphate enzyme (YggS family)
MINQEVWAKIKETLDPKAVTLVAVSKIKPVEDIKALYDLGQRDFGENYVQELTDKAAELPKDIRWHFIGHLQSNKVKYIAPFVHMIHGVDSFKLLTEINKQGLKNERVIDVLLQMHIAQEETKFGMDERDLTEFFQYYEAQEQSLQNVRICGLMGMATATDDEGQIRAEFKRMNAMLTSLQHNQMLGKSYFNTCSMGMSSDYGIAIDEGSTMVRIGSLLFGRRNYNL